MLTCTQLTGRQEERCTGPAKQVKLRFDCGAMANIVPLSVFKRLNPSEFYKEVIPFQGLTGT